MKIENYNKLYFEKEELKDNNIYLKSLLMNLNDHANNLKDETKILKNKIAILEFKTEPNPKKGV